MSKKRKLVLLLAGEFRCRNLNTRSPKSLASNAKDTICWTIYWSWKFSIIYSTPERYIYRKYGKKISCQRPRQSQNRGGKLNAIQFLKSNISQIRFILYIRITIYKDVCVCVCLVSEKHMLDNQKERKPKQVNHKMDKQGLEGWKRKEGTIFHFLGYPSPVIAWFASVSANTAKDVILYPFYFAKNSIFFKQTTPSSQDRDAHRRITY